MMPQSAAGRKLAVVVRVGAAAQQVDCSIRSLFISTKQQRLNNRDNIHKTTAMCGPPQYIIAGHHLYLDASVFSLQ